MKTHMQGADDTKQRAMPPEAAVLTLLTLPSRIGAVEEAAAAVAALLRRSGTAEHITQGIELAVREAVANAVLGVFLFALMDRLKQRA